MNLTTTELLEMIDIVIPELIGTRNKIDRVLIQLKMFKLERKVTDKGKSRVILKVIQAQLGITHEDLISPNRTANIRQARQIYCALARSITRMSLAEIGKGVNRDHATVIHSCKVIKDARDTRDILYDNYQSVEVAVLEVLDS